MSSARMQTAHEAPWTPVDQRVARYPVGFVAFAPSPGPNGEFYADYKTSVPPSPEATEVPKNQEKRSYPEWAPSSKGKGKEPSWEHVVVAKGGLLTVSEIPDEETRRSGGYRTGKLDPQTKEKAHRIRKMGACWKCWIGKVPVSFIPHGKFSALTTGQCSEGEPCSKCLSLIRKDPSLTAEHLCWRSSFKEYEPTFFPGWPCPSSRLILPADNPRLHACASPEKQDRRPHHRKHKSIPGQYHYR
jgi:hypothetical protein